MTVKEFNTAWLSAMVRLQKTGVDATEVEVVVRAMEDGVLEINTVALEEIDDNPEYAEHVRSGGKREFTLVIEGV